MSRVDYSVRPNKSIERKLILECFLLLTAQFPIRRYQYVGFGSFWFADFQLYHKRLGIKKMVSIERENLAPRAAFNSPLRCISVHAGESTLVLPSIKYQTNSILWLDYDKGLAGPWKDDADIVLQDMKPGGVYITTVNASKGQLNNVLDDDNKTLAKADALEQIVGDLMPNGTESSDITNSRFPPLVGKILIACFRRIVRQANPDWTFRPLFNFRYADNATMVTVGGIVVDKSTEKKLDLCGIDSIAYLTGEDQCDISAPLLTLKEKQALDKKLPKASCISPNEVPAKLRTCISTKDINGYQRFYQYYPVFSEVFD